MGRLFRVDVGCWGARLELRVERVVCCLHACSIGSLLIPGKPLVINVDDLPHALGSRLRRE